MAISSGIPEQTTIDILRRVLGEHKLEVLNQPDRLAGVLGDHFPRVEANLLIAVMRAGIPQQIVSARPDTPGEVLLGTLQNRMVRDHGFSTMSAKWAVQTWFGALRAAGPSQGSIVPDLERNRIPPPLPTPTPLPTRLQKRSAVGSLVLGGIAVAVVMVVIVLIVWTRKPPAPIYEFQRLSFFESDKLEVSPWELQDYNSWCDYPSNQCVTITAFKTQTPYVQSRLAVSFPSDDEITVPLHCTAVNGDSQVSSDITGRLPDPQYPRLRSTGWLIPFKAPDAGWTVGNYQVTCTTDKGSVQSTFKVEP